MVVEPTYQISVTKNKIVATELERQNSSTTASLDVQKIADIIAKEEISGEQNNPTLKQHYISLMDQLEIDGIPKEKISTIGKQIIITKKKQRLYSKGIESEEITVGSWWYDIAREKGCIDPHYSHTTNNPSLEKNPKPISSYQTENQSWIDVIDDTIEFLRAEKSFLHKNHFNSKIPQNQSRESILLMSKAITHANERFNNKLKIAPSHYSVLFRNFIHSMSSHLSVPYYEHVREKETFTAKQAGKIIRGTIKDLPYQFEPITPDEAEADGFSGESCPECGNFRTEITMRVQQYKENGIPKSRGIRQIHCFKEDKDYDAPKSKMPAENISESEW